MTDGTHYHLRRRAPYGWELADESGAVLPLANGLQLRLSVDGNGTLGRAVSFVQSTASMQWYVFDNGAMRPLESMKDFSFVPA